LLSLAFKQVECNSSACNTAYYSSRYLQ